MISEEILSVLSSRSSVKLAIYSQIPGSKTCELNVVKTQMTPLSNNINVDNGSYNLIFLNEAYNIIMSRRLRDQSEGTVCKVQNLKNTTTKIVINVTHGSVTKFIYTSMVPYWSYNNTLLV